MEPSIKKPRFFTLDLIKALGILMVILIHTNAYFLSIPLAYKIWDCGQIFVPLFVFSSSFIFFRKTIETGKTEPFQYTIKRTFRLLPPYYIFLAVYFFLIFLAKPTVLTLSFMIPHIILTGGIDSNWLVLLFLYFSFIFPVIPLFWKKSKHSFFILLFIALFFSCLFLIYQSPWSYRITMVAPWLLIVFVAFFCALDFPNITRRVMGIGISSVIVGACSYLLLNNLHKPLEFFQNKYPPNLYYLSLGIVCIILLYCLNSVIEKTHPILKIPFEYLSKNIYSLYFIHQLVIYGVTVNLHHWPTAWPIFFIETLGISLVIQFMLQIILDLLFPKKHLTFSPH